MESTVFTSYSTHSLILETGTKYLMVLISYLLLNLRALTLKEKDLALFSAGEASFPLHTSFPGLFHRVSDAY